MRTGLVNDGWVEVTEGLKGDERVVVVGQAGLKTGTVVKVVDGAAPAGAATARTRRPSRTSSARRRPGQGKSMQLIDFAIRRRVTVVMCTVAIALFGLVSLTRLKVNLLPDLSYPTLTIRTELPGAAPLELETLVTRPVEEAVSIIRNVRQVRSVSRSGQSDVTLEFVWGTDMDLAGIDVREKLDLLQLPLEAKRPLLLRFDPSSEPVHAARFPRQGRVAT